MVKSKVDNGLGVVIRNNNGKILVVRVRKADQLWSVEMWEAAVALFGIELASNLGYMFVHLEGDALNVICNILEAKEGAAPIFLFNERIAKLKEVFLKFLCTHVCKADNKVDHEVAFTVVKNANDKISTICFSQCLISLASSNLI